MAKLLRISLAVMFLLSLTVASVSARPASLQTGDEGDDGTDGQQSEMLCGILAETPGLGERADAIAAFQVDATLVDNTNISEFDTMFIQHGVLGNTMELMSLEYAKDKVKTEELRCAIEMMIAMHTMDLKTFTDLATQLGVDVNIDPTMAPVYPHTPEYNLGERQVNLVEKFLDPLAQETVAPFDARAMHVLKQQHTMLLNISLTAEHLVMNPEIMALAKHSVDVAGLHLFLLEDLFSWRYFDYRVPMNFEEPYMDPHITPPPVTPTPVSPTPGGPTGTSTPMAPTGTPTSGFPTQTPTSGFATQTPTYVVPNP